MGWRFLKAANKQTAKPAAKIGNTKSTVEIVETMNFRGLNHPKTPANKRSMMGIDHQRLQRTLFLKWCLFGVFSLGVRGWVLWILKILKWFNAVGKTLLTLIAFLSVSL